MFGGLMGALMGRRMRGTPSIGRGYGASGAPGSVMGRMMGGTKPTPPAMPNAPIAGGFGASNYGGGLQRVDSAPEIPGGFGAPTYGGGLQPAPDMTNTGFVGGVMKPQVMPKSQDQKQTEY